LIIESKNRLVFSLISAGRSKTKSFASLQRNGSQKPSIDRLQTLADKNKGLNTVIYRTEVQPKTINPEWNEHFELYVDDRFL